MVRAATAPMLFACPTAAMHSPTLNADDLAVTTLTYLVVAVVVTVTVTPARAPGLALAPGLAPTRGALPCTTKPLADSEVTLPLAPPKPPPNAPRLPLGRGRALKLGLVVKLPRGPPSPPPNPNPDPGSQLPLTGVLTVTVVAVTDRVADPLAAPPAGGWPITVTQLPTVTSRDAAATSSVIAVAEVKVTVTCPLVEFWTSRLEADTAAAVPMTPGKAACELAGAGLLLLLATGGAAVAPEPPQAVTARTASPARAGVQRRQLRQVADTWLIAAPFMVNSHSRGCSLAARLLIRFAVRRWVGAGRPG